MSGWKTFHLEGKVKEIRYYDGRVIVFNTDGNVIKQNVRETYQSASFEYEYTSPIHFTQSSSDFTDNTEYTVSFRKNTRRELNKDGEGTVYKFDEEGRLIERHTPDRDKAGAVETYYYKEGERLPSQGVFKLYDKEGEASAISSYVYKETDEYGNWLVCDVITQVEEIFYANKKKKSDPSDLGIAYDTHKRIIEYFTEEELAKGESWTSTYVPVEIDSDDMSSTYMLVGAGVLLLLLICFVVYRFFFKKKRA